MIFLCIGTTVIVSGVHVGLGNYVRSGVIMVVPFPSGLIVRMQEETGGGVIIVSREKYPPACC